MNSPSDFWPHCGFHSLARDARGWLVPAEAYFQWILARPELALVPESCAAEMALHQSLAVSPLRPVAPQELTALADDDARANHAVFLRFRDALVNAGTLEAYYLQLMRCGAVNVPAVFIDAVVQALLRNVLDDCNDAFEARAAEMLFRPQRVTLQEGQRLAGDRATLDMLNETAGLGEVGRLLLQSGALQPTAQVRVLSADNAAQYWQESDRHHFLLDLTHELTQDLSHGLTFKMTRARSGLKALARVLERWVTHFHGAAVRIEPAVRVDDPAWRWHLGLDVESTQLLNALYTGQAVASERQARLISLFRLRFDEPADMREDVRGTVVYLGLAMAPDGSLKLKPQNLLINLPLATRA